MLARRTAEIGSVIPPHVQRGVPLKRRNPASFLGMARSGMGASSLSRYVGSAGDPCQLDEPEQPADAVGRYVPCAVPQALAGASQPAARDIDFQGDDRFDA